MNHFESVKQVVASQVWEDVWLQVHHQSNGPPPYDVYLNAPWIEIQHFIWNKLIMLDI